MVMTSETDVKSTDDQIEQSQQETIVDRIRSVPNYASQLEVRTNKLVADIKEQVVDQSPIIRADDFLERYLIGILSDNVEESEYHMKMLAADVGGLSIPFNIIDERNMEHIFHVPAIGPVFMTSNRDLGENGTTSAVMKYYQSQLRSNPHVARDFQEGLADATAMLMRTDIAEAIHHQVWLEISDYFGLMTDVERKSYSLYAQSKAMHKRYNAWCNPLTIPEYHEKYGYQKTTLKRNTKDPIANPLNTTQTKVETKPAQKQVIVIEDTDDWE